MEKRSKNLTLTEDYVKAKILDLELYKNKNFQAEVQQGRYVLQQYCLGKWPLEFYQKSRIILIFLKYAGGKNGK